MINRIDIDNYNEDDSMIGKQPTNEHYDNVISCDTDLYINGIMVLKYRILTGEVLKYANYLNNNAKITSGKRVNGLGVSNDILGFMPRNPTRCNWCRATASSKKNPKNFGAAVKYAEMIDSLYDCEHDNNVLNDWLLGSSRFSTLNINKNFAIKYHRDSGNIKSQKSNVFICRKNATGGRLVIPHANIAFEQKNGALIIFDGHSIVHGVTPIEIHSGGYRSSLVLYTMLEMKNCLSPVDESKRAGDRYGEIAREKRNGSPKLRARYAKKIAEWEANNE